MIIGIDPGSRITGYGLIRMEGNQSIFVDCGSIHASDDNTATRLQTIYQGLQKIINLYQPQAAAIEQVFMHQNPGSALKLGQARGAAMVALNIPIAEYSARQVKQAVVGYGAATKEQVQHMVQRLLSLTQPLQADAADALAIALCHAHTRNKMPGLITQRTRKGKKKNTWRQYQPSS